ncbi:MAG: TRAP transporter fused permease subunit [Rhodobacteraceae bacterium]|nr:TRAP transporter fused permease subunit [Paracoccaceae bacterium]
MSSSDSTGIKVVDPESALPMRVDSGLRRWVFLGLTLAISLVCLAFVLDVTFILRVRFFQEQYFGLLYGLVFAAGFLRLPATPSAAYRPVPFYDWILSAAGLAVGIYLTLKWNEIIVMSGFIVPERTTFALISVILILELTRRAFGWPLVILTAMFFGYGIYRSSFPGAFGGRSIPWRRMVNFVYTDTEAMMGIIASVVFGMVFAFMLFGRALFIAGGGNFFTDLSISGMGHRRGGPAKVSVIASSIFGTLSGSASSNVVVTGSITIPMMIKSGYRRASAAAIEAVSSRGGGLMPPVMGATAVLMAEFLAVPYYEVVLAALLPALLYYITLFFQIDLEAGKLGLRGLPRSECPRFWAVMKAGWLFLVPLATLIYCLFVIFLSPSKSAMVAFVSVVAISFLLPLKLTPRRMLDTLTNTGNLMVEMGILAAIAGMIVGIISLTGLGLLFSQQLLSLAGGSLFLLLLFTAVASIIMGMSMPVTASYVILAVIAAPAIVQAGITPMAAHLFIFYFAVLSFITPPVCVAVFVAATLARAKPMQAALVAMQLAVVAFVVPFVFVYDQSLLMMGSPLTIMFEFVTVCIGFLALSMALQGHFMAPVGLWVRAGLAVAGFGAVVPDPMVKLPAVAVALGLMGLCYLQGRRAASEASDEPAARADNVDEASSADRA